MARKRLCARAGPTVLAVALLAMGAPAQAEQRIPTEADKARLTAGKEPPENRIWRVESEHEFAPDAIGDETAWEVLMKIGNKRLAPCISG